MPGLHHTPCTASRVKTTNSRVETCSQCLFLELADYFESHAMTVAYLKLQENNSQLNRIPWKKRLTSSSSRTPTALPGRLEVTGAMLDGRLLEVDTLNGLKWGVLLPLWGALDDKAVGWKVSGLGSPAMWMEVTWGRNSRWDDYWWGMQYWEDTKNQPLWCHCTEPDFRWFPEQVTFSNSERRQKDEVDSVLTKF